MLLLFWHGVDEGDGASSSVTYYVVVTGPNPIGYVFDIDPTKDVEYAFNERPSPATYTFDPVGRVIL